MPDTLFAKLRPVAQKNLDAYAEDFFTHDKRSLRIAKPGSTYIWVCRPTGTHLALTNAPEGEVTREDLALSWDLLDALRDFPAETVKAIAVVEVTSPQRGSVTWIKAIPARPEALRGVHNKRQLL